MIQPHIQLIENKFSDGKALTDQDVNTLLLKSQFNHINHLDLRLDEVAADVAQLRLDVSGRDGKFQALEARFISFESRMEATIEKTMKSHIKWTLGLMTFCLTLFKIIDLVLQN